MPEPRRRLTSFVPAVVFGNGAEEDGGGGHQGGWWEGARRQWGSRHGHGMRQGAWGGATGSAPYDVAPARHGRKAAGQLRRGMGRRGPWEAHWIWGGEGHGDISRPRGRQTEVGAARSGGEGGRGRPYPAQGRPGRPDLAAREVGGGRSSGEGCRGGRRLARRFKGLWGGAGPWRQQRRLQGKAEVARRIEAALGGRRGGAQRKAGRCGALATVGGRRWDSTRAHGR